MTKNEMNYDEQQHQVVRGRDDIKVGDVVLTNHNDIAEVIGKGKGLFFTRYILKEQSKYEENYFYYYKKHRWQLFKINN